MDAPLRSACRQIDGDYFPGFLRSPFVHEKSRGGGVTLRGDFECAPIPLVINIFTREAENFLEERETVRIGRLVRSQAQRDRQANFASFEFALLIEAHSG